MTETGLKCAHMLFIPKPLRALSFPHQLNAASKIDSKWPWGLGLPPTILCACHVEEEMLRGQAHERDALTELMTNAHQLMLVHVVLISRVIVARKHLDQRH